MFAKKRSIIMLEDILNPTYQYSFLINNEKYLITVDSIITIDLEHSFDNPLTTNIILDENLSKFRIVVNKIKDDGYSSFEEYKEFNNYNDTIKYIRSWKDKQNSQ